MVKTAADGNFQVRGIVPGTYKATFIPRSQHSPSTHEFDSLNLPNPWRIVLEERPRSKAEGDGTLWLRFTDEDLHVSNLRVHVALYSPWAAAKVASLSESLEGGNDLYKSGVAPGVYMAVVRPQGYAPVILDGVRITASPSDPTSVRLSKGVPAVFEVEGPLERASIQVREAHSGFLVSAAYSPPVKEGTQRVTTRLEPGEYLARLRVKGSVVAEKAFVLEALADGSTPSVRFEREDARTAAKSEK